MNRVKLVDHQRLGMRRIWASA